MNDLKTRFFYDVDKNCPLPEYPRPQLVREDWMCLNGECDYEITPAGDACPKDFSGKIILPFAIESQLSGVQRALQPDERLWYRKRFTLDSRFDNKRCILHFGAVDWQCEVFVNGVSVGTHTGGYCPFSFDITDELVDGENELVVKVYDPTDKGWQNRGKQVLKSVGFWYTGTSGVWQTVWLEPVAQSHITCPLHLDAVHLPARGTALLEDLGNLTANELYDPAGAGPQTAQAILSGLDAVYAQCETLIVVSNEVFSGGADYAGDTDRYLLALAQVNNALAARADAVVRVVCGIPVYYKGVEK